MKKNKLLLYFGLLLLLLNYLNTYSTLFSYDDNISKIILFLGAISLFIFIILKNERKYILNLSLIVLGIFEYFIIGETSFLQLFLILISIKDENIEDIIKILFKVTLIYLVIHIIVYCLMYFYDDSMLGFSFRYEGAERRHNFLFIHSNIFASIVCWNMLEYLYLKRNSINFKDLIITFIVAIFIIVFPNSRTSALVLIMNACILYFYDSIFNIVKSLMKNSIIVIAILFLSLVFIYNKYEFIKNIDNNFSSRIRQAYAINQIYGIKPFGQKIDILKEDKIYWKYALSKVTIDSTYYKLLYNYGYITIILFLLIVHIKTRRISKDDNICCFIFAYAIFASMETHAIFPLIAFPIMLVYCNNSKHNISDIDKSVSKKGK